MSYKTFNETLVWKKTEEFIAALKENVDSTENTWFTIKLMETACKAAVQIAEGYERFGDEMLLKYLEYAKDNLTKCRALLTISITLNILTETVVAHLKEKADDASKLIYGLSKYLKNKAKAA